MKNNPIIKSHGFLMFSDVSSVSASLSSLPIADFRGFVRAVAPQKRGMASRPLQASARSSLSGLGGAMQISTVEVEEMVKNMIWFDKGANNRDFASI